MKKATLIDPHKRPLLTFDLPETLHDVSLAAFIDFLVESRGVTDETSASTFVAMSNAVAKFYNIDLDVVFNASIAFGADVDSYRASVTNLYGYAIDVISKFKVATSTEDRGLVFEYEGFEYAIPPILPSSIEGEHVLPNLTVLQAVEMCELSRLREQAVNGKGDPDGAVRVKFDKMIEEKIGALASQLTDGEMDKIRDIGDRMRREEIEATGDPDGSHMYSYYLRALAVLAKREGESIPIKDSERETWINARAKQFERIDAGTALNVDFFLTSILGSYESAGRVDGFLSRQCFAVVAEMRLRSEKPLKKRSNTRSKSLRK
ncbi:MAG: hypothetical protein ACRCVX_14275 [Shewanella sp.]